jgi:hypothetical protein
MPTIVGVADHIIAEDLPVLFVDTCVLLDVIRSIKRKFTNCALQAQSLHSAATAVPRECLIVISHLVRHEWGVHQQELLDEADRHLSELQEHSGHFHDACGVLGIAPGFGRANYAAHDVAVRLHDLSRQILDCALVVEQDYECSNRAITRVIYNVPPSKKGGEAKDCTILEEYLAIARRLHAAGFQKKRVFCTSNTNDYCEGRALHPDLAAEFAVIDLRFTSNLGWGFHDVTH